MPHPDRSNRRDHENLLLSTLIEQFADRSAALREQAASEIFRIGRERAVRCARSWLSDPVVAKLFVFDEGDFPRTTVGVGVQPEKFERIRAVNAFPPLADLPPDLDAKEFEIHAGKVRLDVLTTRDATANGALARFLRRFGEGIQQVELNVHDVNRASATLRERFRIEPVYGEARPGADGSLVNFFLVADGNEKLLIELVELPTRVP
ncbi:MAG TPA: hypothetical protein VMB47_14735 [Candidatus Aquilonibacter sp.]|nr:hypothetical protein [Candidatus Aquilonibacter sp.]